LLQASSLFSVNDADGDTITAYEFYDATPGGGYFSVNGVAQTSPLVQITASQLAQTTFQAGAGTDNLYVRAFDGTGWSSDNNVGWTPFHVNGPVNHIPVITAPDTAATAGHTLLQASSLFSVNDADGDTITAYEFYDATPGGGYFSVNGVAQTSPLVQITASQLAQTTFQAGSGTDNLYVRASDGTGWSSDNGVGWTPFHVSGPVNHAPVITAPDTTATTGHTLLQASSLFSVNDSDGDSMTVYEFYDATAGGGYFSVNGVAQTNPLVHITAAQLSVTTFQTGGGTDNLYVRAFDGAAWSSDNGVGWTPFHVTGPTSETPIEPQASLQHDLLVV
jgi:hypothetical protein